MFLFASVPILWFAVIVAVLIGINVIAFRWIPGIADRTALWLCWAAVIVVDVVIFLALVRMTGIWDALWGVRV